MTVTLDDLESILRPVIGDDSISGKDIFTAVGSSSVFTLTESNVIAITSVLVNDVSSGITYSYSSSTNKLTITSSLTAGDIVEIQYTLYNDYSSTELQQYLKSALSYISINNYKDFIVSGASDEVTPVPTDAEQNLIAVIAATLIKPGNKSYRLPDLTISVTSKELSTDQKIGRIIGLYKSSKVGIFSTI